ncbi:hypothetical protein PS710_03775 [Pseudomonas fluorescens]|uniref:Uncharacterized protein n=1 Tax=Pseudomonas fluorescens TaxID=294 RepID=A0A5E7DT67_PSEFL|nr:hypothetical protein PS710_03775 [Pseudomonas fluorescens]
MRRMFGSPDTPHFIQCEPAFDEPTNSLSTREIDRLMAIIGRLRPGIKSRSVCSG